MNTVISPSTNRYLWAVPYSSLSQVRNNNTNVVNVTRFGSTLTTNVFSHSLVHAKLSARATSDEVDMQIVTEELVEETNAEEKTNQDNTSTFSAPIDKELKKVAQKTAATFAPRASTATKNPAVPGTVLYTVFEVQGYITNHEAIPSLRARDCSKNEKEALNYLFLLVPLINVVIPFFWKSFAIVWSADVVAFLGMYSWKVGWFQRTD